MSDAPKNPKPEDPKHREEDPNDGPPDKVKKKESEEDRIREQKRQ